MNDDTNSLASLLDREVVLDTAGSITYLGTLKAVRPEGYWLENADFRDRIEGHATKEFYICEARRDGIRPNRRRIFVTREVVISLSALEDVIDE